MNRNYLVLIFIFFIFYSCKDKGTGRKLTGNISNDIQSLLPPGEFIVDVMDSVVQSEREALLSSKMQLALYEHREWYSEYIAKYRESRVLPYHVNFGLTESEYYELMQMKLNITLAASASHKVNVKISSGIIQFYCNEALPYLESLMINTNDNTVFLEQFPLSFSDTVFVANENHGLKSMWKGYSWKFTDPKDEDTVSDRMNTRHYNVSIGELYKSGNTVIIINKHEETDGSTSLKLDKPLVFRKL